jgi:hypothetical protein
MKKVVSRMLAAGAMALLASSSVPLSNANAAQALRAPVRGGNELGLVIYCEQAAQCEADACMAGTIFVAPAALAQMPMCTLRPAANVTRQKAERCKLTELQDSLKCLEEVAPGRPAA